MRGRTLGKQMQTREESITIIIKFGLERTFRSPLVQFPCDEPGHLQQSQTTSIAPPAPKHAANCYSSINFYSNLNSSWGFPRALRSQHPVCPSSRPLHNSPHALHLPSEISQPPSPRKSREVLWLPAAAAPGECPTAPGSAGAPSAWGPGGGGKVLSPPHTTTTSPRLRALQHCLPP